MQHQPEGNITCVYLIDMYQLICYVPCILPKAKLASYPGAQKGGGGNTEF
jgi:hypothetical protein